jgi:hypothetical protein
LHVEWWIKIFEIWLTDSTRVIFYSLFFMLHVLFFLAIDSCILKIMRSDFAKGFLIWKHEVLKEKKNRRETIKIGILLVSIIYLFSGKGQTQSLWKITVLTLRIFIYDTEMECVWTYRDWNIVYPLLNTCTIILPSSLWFRSL